MVSMQSVMDDSGPEHHAAGPLSASGLATTAVLLIGVVIIIAALALLT
jgi:hypothetical protein